MPIDFESIKAKVLPYFIAVYGPEYEPLIIERINNIIPVFYRTMEYENNQLLNILRHKRAELTLRFLDYFQISIDPTERETIATDGKTYSLSQNPATAKALSLFFDDHEFRHPTYSTLQKLTFEPLEGYNLKRAVQLLNKIDISVTEENYNEWINTPEAQELKQKLAPHLQFIQTLNDEYVSFEQKYAEIQNIIKNSDRLKTHLEEKYYLSFLEAMRPYMKQEEVTLLEDFITKRDKTMYSFTRNLSFASFVGESFHTEGFVEGFTEEAEETLNNPKKSDYQKECVIEKRQKYLQSIGIEIEDVLSPEARAHYPSPEMVADVIAQREKFKKQAIHEHLSLTSSFQKDREYIDTFSLTDNQLKLEDYEMKATCIRTALKKEGDTIHSIGVLLFNPFNIDSVHSDVLLIHEINHAIELCLLGFDGDKAVEKCGFEILRDIEGLERPYEQFSEVINHMIAMEVAERMHEDGVYIFNNPKTAKITGGTSYEQQRPLIQQFYQTFKTFIIKARTSTSLDSLFQAVGKENFDALNTIINTYQQLPYYKMMDDVINHRTTELTEKRTQIIQAAQDVFAKMLEYSKAIQLPVEEKLAV